MAEPPVTSAVLKLSLHCEGCIDRIYRTVSKTKGYKEMEFDHQKDLLTVTGAMDMKALAEVLQKKMKREVAIVPPKKDREKKEKDCDGDGGDGDKGKRKSGAGVGDKGKRKSGGGGDENGGRDKAEGNKMQPQSEYPSKPAPQFGNGQPPVTSAVLKLSLHCEGCIDRIYRTVSKTKGYKEMEFDHQKDLMTVTGAMDMKALAEVLQKKMKREVAIVPPKKEREKKEKDSDCGDKGKKKSGAGVGDKGKRKSGGGGDENDGGEKAEGNQMQPQFENPSYPCRMAHYEAFCDENPNACSLL